MRSIRLLFSLALGLLVCFVVAKTVWAGTLTIHQKASGSGQSVILDTDGDNVLHRSSLGNSAGTSNIGPFTLRGVNETDPVSGTGCSFAPTTIAGCTIDSTTHGCEFHIVGGAQVRRSNDSGDLIFYKLTDGTTCINFTSGLPFDFTNTGITATVLGGTGGFAGVTGSVTTDSHGQILVSDGVDSFSWFEATSEFNLTCPGECPQSQNSQN